MGNKSYLDSWGKEDPKNGRTTPPQTEKRRKLSITK